MVAPVRLILPFPMMMSPPQSPGLRLPTARADVKTIGSAAVPSASIFAPRRIQSELPATVVSPMTLVPGSIVRVAPLCTLTNPLTVYTVSLTSVRFAVIAPVRVPFASPVGAGAVLSSPLQPTIAPAAHADRPTISSIFPCFIGPPRARCCGAVCSRCCAGESQELQGEDGLENTAGEVAPSDHVALRHLEWLVQKVLGLELEVDVPGHGQLSRDVEQVAGLLIGIRKSAASRFQNPLARNVVEHRRGPTARVVACRQAGVHHVFRLSDHGAVRIGQRREPGIPRSDVALHQCRVGEERERQETRPNEAEVLPQLELDPVVLGFFGVYIAELVGAGGLDDHLFDGVLEPLGEYADAYHFAQVREPLPPEVEVLNERALEVRIPDRGEEAHLLEVDHR